MASTYVNALRLNEMGTGDESGSWGTVTNLNLDMIGEAFGYGAEAIADASTHTITMADGAVDEARNIYLKCTGGGQACTVTLAPNTVSKIWIIENATSYTLTFSQGSGANVAVPASDVKVIATDGAGGGAVVYDLFVDLNIATKLTIKNPATSASPATLLLQTGDTAVVATDVLGKIQFQAPDETGADAILVAAAIEAVATGTFAAAVNATKLSFKTAASEAATEKMSLSSGGNLTLPTDGVVTSFGADSDVLLTHVADSGLTMSVTGNNVAQLSVTQDKDDASTGPVFNLNRYSASPADADGGGLIQFNMENDNNQLFNAAQIYAVAVDVTDTTEDGKLVINTMKAGTATTALTISDTGIQVPDDGNIGSVSDTDAIHIGSEGQVGVGIAAGDTIQFRVYNNETGHYAGWFRQDNASSTTSCVYAAHDGAGSAFQGSSAGHVNYCYTSSASHAAFFGQASDTSNYALIGYGTHGCYATSVYCVGAMYKGSGSFRIPHGLREGYDLLHSFIEGPQCDLIYRGKVDLVNGAASISMDTKYGMTAGTFEWLTKDIQTFTSNETGWDAVRSSFSGDTITIECQNASSTDTISWMVVAERDDSHIKASEMTDDDGNLIIERPSEPEPDVTPPPTPTPTPPPPPEPEED